MSNYQLESRACFGSSSMFNSNMHSPTWYLYFKFLTHIYVELYVTICISIQRILVNLANAKVLFNQAINQKI